MASLPEGKAKVKLEQDGSVLIVDEGLCVRKNQFTELHKIQSIFLVIEFVAFLISCAVNECIITFETRAM